MSASTHAPASRAAVVIALLLVYVVWGSTYLAIRIAVNSGAEPLTFVAGTRFIIAGGLMYAFLRWRGEAGPTRAQWPNVAMMGFCLLLLGNGMVVLAERQVSSGLAAIAVASVPLWMAVFGTLRGQRPNGAEWIGIVTGFLGVVCLILGSAMGASTADVEAFLNQPSSLDIHLDGAAIVDMLSATPGGLVLLLVAPVGWAFGSVWSRGRDLPSPFMTSATQMLSGGVMLVITGVIIGERPHEWPSASGMAAVGYLIVFGSLVAFTAYVWLLHNVRPVLASSYAYVNPVIAVLLGVGLLNERFNVYQLAAMGVTLLGVVVVTLAKAKR